MNEISVVICVKNAENTINTCINSIIKNLPLEIIVIDDGSDDNTLEIIKEYNIRIFSTGGKGVSYARQLGAEKAKGTYIAYADSDTELPDRNSLNKMLIGLENNNWVAIHAQIIDPRSNKSYYEYGEDFHWQNRFNKVGEKDHLATMVCIIRKDLIIRYKFDRSFLGAAEDADFYARLRKEGYKFGVSSVIAYHYHRSSFANFSKQRKWYGKGNARAIFKHKAIHLIITPLFILIYGIFISIYKKKPKFIPFYLIWMFYLSYGTFTGLYEIIFKKS